MTSTTTAPTAHRPLASVNRWGLKLAAGLAVFDVLSLFVTPQSSDTQAGPPIGVVVLGVLLAAVTLVLVVQALRTGARGLVRGVAATRILSVITGLPAFFVDVDAWVKVLVGVAVLLTVTAVVLMFRPSGERIPVTD